MYIIMGYMMNKDMRVYHRSGICFMSFPWAHKTYALYQQLITDAVYYSLSLFCLKMVLTKGATLTNDFYQGLYESYFFSKHSLKGLCERISKDFFIIVRRIGILFHSFIDLMSHDEGKKNCAAATGYHFIFMK